MIGILGKVFINAAFVCAILAAIGYYLYAQKDENRYYRISNWLFGFVLGYTTRRTFPSSSFI